MDLDRVVLVIGASGIDVKGRILQPFQAGITNAGVVRNTLGGVARNIAENLARLEVPVVLLSAVGQDQSGKFLVEHTSAVGVDMTYVLRVPDAHTGSYLAIQDTAGRVLAAVSEYEITSAISPAYLQRHRALFARAAMIVIDASLSPRALESVFLWARRYNVPVCADPTAQGLANKLCRFIPDLFMLVPDDMEAAELCGAAQPPASREAALEMAQRLVSLGTKTAIVTLAEQGVVYADGGSSGHIPALRTHIVDKTGVGDALTAAVICGLFNDMPLDEAVRLGVSAAAITLRTRETVAPDLTLDRLYNELVV